MSPDPSPPEATKPCPNCGALIPTTWIRCLECGKSLRPPILRFDLDADLTPTNPETTDFPTWLPAPVWDRLFGATLPFVLSLVWLGGVVAFVGPTGVPEASLVGAPVLRFLLPWLAALLLKERFPYLAGGFHNALSLAKQLLLTHVFFVPIYLVLWGIALVNGVWISGGCLSPPQFKMATTFLSFAPTTGIAVATLLIQGIMASILPFLVTVGKDGIRLSRELASPRGYGSLLVVFLLALNWWLPNAIARPVVGGLAALLSGVLAVLRIDQSPDLSTTAKRLLTALVIVLELIAVVLVATPSAPPEN